MAVAKQLKAYYYLTKPGIIRGNLLTATAGFLLAAKHHVPVGRGIVMLLGLGLIIAAACVSNNILDRGIDKKMARTAKRALVSGAISVPAAGVFAGSLLGAGSLLLGFGTNLLSLVAALVGYVAYVAVYGYFKRRSTHSTAVGSISGAIPPVVGYVAISNHLDAAAVMLFIILVCWQMPHFFAIALYRLKDYDAAGLPVLPVKKGARTTKLQSLGYIIVYLFASLALSLFGYTGIVYAVTITVIGLVWFTIALRGFHDPDSAQWGRSVFLCSLLVITVQCVLIGANALLP